MMQDLKNSSYLFGGNLPFIEELYEQYLSDANSVGDDWRVYFDQLAATGNAPRDIPHYPIQESFKALAQRPAALQTTGMSDEALNKQVGVLRLISAYRVLGARYANLDPLKLNDLPNQDELNPVRYGLSDQDMATTFSAGTLTQGEKLPLSQIIARLQTIYCGTIGLEFMHMKTGDERHWIQKRFETELSTPRFDKASKTRILKQVTAAETLERYLHTKYVGQKRFSLEGGESMIAAMDHLIQNGTALGVEEIIIGMAHRGRLNVLVNTLGKLPSDLFAEFEGKYKATLASGDVKYHMGFSSDISTPNGAMHVSLAFNPSHLEIVNPVVEGSVRARQTRRKDHERKAVLPVLMHGDSAFGGLGVNQGTFQLSQTTGYTTGGTIHLVINNQVGFTTSSLGDLRSSEYCTDIAKMVDAPIFHVNGDDPEAVCYVMQIALEYRMAFKKDVVIDLVCYRKQGHNEADDPTLTQPFMYKHVQAHKGSRAVYAARLAAENTVSLAESEAMIAAYRSALDQGQHVEQTTLSNYSRQHAVSWLPYTGTAWTDNAPTTLSAQDIVRLTKKFNSMPEEFTLHNTVKRTVAARAEMAEGKQAIDWGMAETLAYASLVESGFGVRISGEDSGRGTFSHRHAVVHDQNRTSRNNGTYVPLAHVADSQAPFEVIDSILNEEAVLAYEYGYASAAPDQLVIWEAQFGDFTNGAQVAIDQFITSGETKWGRLCGLVLNMPHGYDGQGPEHSSARLERWLQLCSEHNIQVIMPSEASQMFHALRRQMLRPYRKPLAIFMSKRLLRFKDAMSQLPSFSDQGFRNVIGDPAFAGASTEVKRVILCAGQVYYDLVAARATKGLTDSVALVRIEQLYPFPHEELAAQLALFPNAKSVVWAQEEPKNQGAWYQIRHYLEENITNTQSLSVAARPASASPAVGYMSKHTAQLKALLDEALD
jgi:2-oxoglutarate dehydrogenase E1 component